MLSDSSKRKQSRGRHFKTGGYIETEQDEKALDSDSCNSLESKLPESRRPKTSPPVVKAPSQERVLLEKPIFEKASSVNMYGGGKKFKESDEGELERVAHSEAPLRKQQNEGIQEKKADRNKSTDVLSSKSSVASKSAKEKLKKNKIKPIARINYNEVMISFRDVTKTYHLYKNDRGRFLGLFNYKKKANYLGSVSANRELSFDIYKGEAVAFLGQNGAGKSTALKIVTGVTLPTTGRAMVKGRVSALLELNAGFDSQLTGRENIGLRGQALGLARSEIKALEPKIIEFAELGVYIDQPLRTYSSGMRSRLGFAFAVSIDPEILVIDETLSVGDKNFKDKCLARVREIMSDRDVTVLFVTHSSDVAKEFCSRGIVLKEGRNVFEGAIDEAILYYNENC